MNSDHEDAIRAMVHAALHVEVSRAHCTACSTTLLPCVALLPLQRVGCVCVSASPTACVGGGKPGSLQCMQHAALAMPFWDHCWAP
ncbi:unnamed protein product [Closterium sp. NIES-54]